MGKGIIRIAATALLVVAVMFWGGGLGAAAAETHTSISYVFTIIGGAAYGIAAHLWVDSLTREDFL
jgi:hypothetical protein